MDRRSAFIIFVIALTAVGTGLVLRAQSGRPGTAGEATTSIATAAPTTTSIADTVTTSTATVTTTVAAVDDGPVCDRYQSVTVAGDLESSGLVETSGIAASRTAPGVVWAHNDSGDEPSLYAVGSDGEDLGSVLLEGGLAFDWEDLAIGPGPGTTDSYLYVGDIGDNFEIRQGQVTVYLVREPDPGALEESVPIDLEVTLESPDGSHNFEALFVADQAIFVVTKDSETTAVYQSSPIDRSGSATLGLIATLDLGAEVTAADMSWDGSMIAFRGYETVWMWRRAPGASVAEALTTEPCAAPSPEERQGESIAFLADGSLVTVSEGSDVALHLVRREP